MFRLEFIMNIPSVTSIDTLEILKYMNITLNSPVSLISSISGLVFSSPGRGKGQNMDLT